MSLRKRSTTGSLVRVDVEGNLEKFMSGRQPSTRYASFDYCFNYFQSFRESGDAKALVAPEHLEESCLHLGFFLASWGMYRGKADLLRRSARHLAPVIHVIASADPAIWELDVNQYDASSFTQLKDIGGRLEDALKPSVEHAEGPKRPLSTTLLTKILLGVFGCVPAFDRYFLAGSRKLPFSAEGMYALRQWYELNRVSIDRHRVLTLDFTSGKNTGRRYTRAKVIDMVFFIEGIKRERN